MTHDVPATFENLALAYAQQRTRLFAALAPGLILISMGAVGFLLAVVLQAELSTSFWLLVVGIFACAVGFLVTLGARLSKKALIPRADLKPTIQKLRTNSIACVVVTIVFAVLAVLVIGFAPRGRETDVITIMVMLVVFPLAMWLVVLKQKGTINNRLELYQRAQNRVMQ